MSSWCWARRPPRSRRRWPGAASGAGSIERPQDGLASSLRIGLDAAAEDAATDAVLVVLGDQPGLRTDVVRTVLAAGEATALPIVRPRYERDGAPNPVLLRRAAWALAAGARGRPRTRAAPRGAPRARPRGRGRGLDPGRRHARGPRGGGVGQRRCAVRTRSRPMTTPERPAGKRATGDAKAKGASPRAKKPRTAAAPTTAPAATRPAKDPATLEAAWADRVRANREQAERFRETQEQRLLRPGLRAVRRRSRGGPASPRSTSSRNRPARTRRGSTSGRVPVAMPCRSHSASAR